MRLKVYTASKLSQALRWETLAEEWPEVELHARWVKGHVRKDDKNPEDCRLCWLEDCQDVARSDVLMVYGEPHEKLRGALIEAGMALALGIPVLVIGEHADFGTWQHHPGVVQIGSLYAARTWLAGYAFMRDRYER